MRASCIPKVNSDLPKHEGYVITPISKEGPEGAITTSNLFITERLVMIATGVQKQFEQLCAITLVPATENFELLVTPKPFSSLISEYDAFLRVLTMIARMKKGRKRGACLIRNIL